MDHRQAHAHLDPGLVGSRLDSPADAAAATPRGGGPALDQRTRPAPGLAPRPGLALASGAEELCADPIGRCLIGSTFALWCAAPDLSGTILWGAPDERDGRALLAAMAFVEHPAVARERCALFDCRAVERVDGEALLEFTRHARERMAEWSPRTRRQAVLVPDGLAGILFTGALATLAPSHPCRVATELEAALAFLDHPLAAAAHAAASAHAEAVRGHAALLGRLRLVLAPRLVEATVESCAAALGLSARTLQRELHRLGTSFSDELRRARVAAADELLRFTDAKIESTTVFCGAGGWVPSPRRC
ncbi:MAG: hypothetical protein K8W52_27745 [Deltaproteobacteria bacterium]|nr:hypothetical protein [Deltaproteobacteria bacterium]